MNHAPCQHPPRQLSCMLRPSTGLLAQASGSSVSSGGGEEEPPALHHIESCKLPLSSGSIRLGPQRPVPSSTPTFPGAARAPAGLSHAAGSAVGQAALRERLSASGCSCFPAAEDFEAGRASQEPPVLGGRCWGWARAPPSGTPAGKGGRAPGSASPGGPGSQRGLHPCGSGTGRLGNRSATGEVSAPRAAAQQAREEAPQEQGRSPGESRGRVGWGTAGRPAFPLVPHARSSQERNGPRTEHTHQARHPGACPRTALQTPAWQRCSSSHGAGCRPLAKHHAKLWRLF